MATLIKTSGEVTEVKPANGKHFSLKELQSMVGGLIEKHSASNDAIFICNEEGLLHNLAPNQYATTMFIDKVDISKKKIIENYFANAGAFVGDVVVCNDTELR